MEVKIHPDAKEHLQSLDNSDRDRCKEALKRLADDPYHRRPKCDIKQLRGREKKMFRLRVGNHRFEYFIEEDVVWVVDAFAREEGYG